jgi:hypothetical protein
MGTVAVVNGPLRPPQSLSRPEGCSITSGGPVGMWPAFLGGALLVSDFRPAFAMPSRGVSP